VRITSSLKCDFVYSFVYGGTVVKIVMSCLLLLWLLVLNVDELVWGNLIAHTNVNVKWFISAIVNPIFISILIRAIIVDIRNSSSFHYFKYLLPSFCDTYSTRMYTFLSWVLYG